MRSTPELPQGCPREGRSEQFRVRAGSRCLGPDQSQGNLGGVERFGAHDIVVTVGARDEPSSTLQAQHLERTGQRIQQPHVGDLVLAVDAELAAAMSLSVDGERISHTQSGTTSKR